MTDVHRTFTPAETAYLLRKPVQAVKKALDRGPVRSHLVNKSGISIRTILWRDVLYMLADQSLRENLSATGRANFYDALKNAQPTKIKEISFDNLSFELEVFIKELDERTQELNRLFAEVEFRSDGEAILKGTSIEVYRIAALLSGGLTVKDILADYPSLSKEKVEVAGAYATAHPKAGRPYPKTTVKRALKNAGFEAFDDLDEVEEA